MSGNDGLGASGLCVADRHRQQVLTIRCPLCQVPLFEVKVNRLKKRRTARCLECWQTFDLPYHPKEAR